MRISDWSSDVCSSDLLGGVAPRPWRVEAAEQDLSRGARPIASALLADANPTEQNAFKLALVERTLSALRSEEHTSELQSLMRISYAVFCLKKNKSRTYQIRCLYHKLETPL